MKNSISRDPVFHLFRVTDRERSVRAFSENFVREKVGGEFWVRFRAGKSYYPIFYPVRPGDAERHRFNFRDFFQISIVVSGSGWHEGQRKVRLKTGDIFIINPRENYCNKPNKAGLDLIILSFRPSTLGYNDAALREANLLSLYSLLSPFAEERVLRNPFRTSDDVFKKILMYAFHSIEEFHFGSSTDIPLRNLQNILELVLGSLPSPKLRENRVPHVMEVVKYLGEHFHEKVPLSELSRMLKLSPTYISTLFNRITGSSIHAYINRLRIESAKVKLRTTRLPIQHVAIEEGYESISHFNAVFKNLVGHTPGKYRADLSLKPKMPKPLSPR